MAILVIDKHSNRWFGVPLKSTNLIRKYSKGNDGYFYSFYRWYMFWEFHGFEDQFDIICMGLRDKMQSELGFSAEYALEEQLTSMEQRSERAYEWNEQKMNPFGFPGMMIGNDGKQGSSDDHQNEEHDDQQITKINIDREMKWFFL